MLLEWNKWKDIVMALFLRVKSKNSFLFIAIGQIFILISFRFNTTLTCQKSTLIVIRTVDGAPVISHTNEVRAHINYALISEEIIVNNG